MSEKKHWSSEMKTELIGLKSRMRLRALADYIVFSFSVADQDAIIRHLQDHTKKFTVHLIVSDRDDLKSEQEEIRRFLDKKRTEPR